MSSLTRKQPIPPEDGEDDGPEPKSPNLFLLYGILAFGLLAAMAFAAMVVYPFYLRR